MGETAWLAKYLLARVKFFLPLTFILKPVNLTRFVHYKKILTKEVKMNARHLVKFHSTLNVPLTYEESYDLGVSVLEGCRENGLARIQSIALLTALHNVAIYKWRKPAGNRLEILHGHRLPENAAEQIAGICAAIFEHDIKCSEFGFLKPKADCVIDNCGMGGDLIMTANMSTISAFIAAAAGITMCKHGSPGNSQRIGSSEFVHNICGINTLVDPQKMADCVDRFNFGYTEALEEGYKHVHVQTHNVAEMPHMNDIIGPITNPVDPKKQKKKILGVNHLLDPMVVAEAYQILNEKEVTDLRHGIFIRGFIDTDSPEGIDEVSICRGGTDMVELINGQIKKCHIEATDFGIETIEKTDLIPPDGKKGEYSLQILNGEINGNRLNAVLANAAMLFYLDGRSVDLKECFAMAKEMHQSGRAHCTMLQVKDFLA
jgi:anthranilate phosphoribosyltransferase